MKRVFLVAILLIAFFTTAFASAAQEVQEEQTASFEFIDSCGRTVILPSHITKIAPSGVVATMFCSSIAPEYMANVNSKLTELQEKYLNPCLQNLPATGQLYGSKATLNTEEIIATGAQVIIDMGDYKKGIAEDLNELQSQTGIPCIFIEADLNHMAEAFRTLGKILDGKNERGEELASFVEKTMNMAKENSAKIKPEEVVKVMLTGAKDGLGTNPKGSSQAQVLEIVGAENAIVLEKFSSKGNGNIINMEQLYNFDPDVIIFSPDSYYRFASSDSTWKSLKAISTGMYYEVPGEPYNWICNPPSLNMILGVWWMGKKLYPQYYTYNLEDVVKEAFDVFWNYKLSNQELMQLI